MNKVTIVLLIIFSFLACSQEQTKKAETGKVITKVDLPEPTTSTDTSSTPLELQFFPALPDTISGCGDYYTYDSVEVAQDKYIFLSNITSFALIRINGEDVYLTKQKTATIYPDDHFISIFKGNGISAVLEVKRIKKYDEGGFYKGTLKIVRGKKALLIWVQGETGC